RLSRPALVGPALSRLEIGGRFRGTDLDSFIATLEPHSWRPGRLPGCPRERGGRYDLPDGNLLASTAAMQLAHGPIDATGSFRPTCGGPDSRAGFCVGAT
ncbi:MAG TPA: hypothetical protein VGO18_24750, partial [Steroidobacteraceae bacterium]|nr:hypothetical protein [Steroidobacteraceae bacterium]